MISPHQLVTVRMSDNLIKKIDVMRGTESRSQIIRQAINEYATKNIDKLEEKISATAHPKNVLI